MSPTHPADAGAAGSPPPIAQISVVEVSAAPTSLTLLVNFGMVAGRTPSRGGIESLWDAIRGYVSGAIISVEQRYEFHGSDAEICLDQVRIEIPDDVASRDISAEKQRILDIARQWAEECVQAIQGTLTLAERLARQAVVGDA